MLQAVVPTFAAIYEREGVELPHRALRPQVAPLVQQRRPHLRGLVEIAWGWIQHQPQSALARWYAERYASAGPAQRKKGIVAVARKLLIALWHYLEHKQPIEGALLKV